MKVLTFSRHYPKGHPKAGRPTWFVEKVLICINWGMTGQELLNSIKPEIKDYVNDFALITEARKHHTIRSGSRWKAGDMASLRVWSDKPYRSKQVEFTQVEVKKVWSIEIWLNDRITIGLPEIPGVQIRMLPLCEVAENDGLECNDFEAWFRLHPKKNGKVFAGQIISWNESIDYGDIEY